jgi:hypothetical protein
LQGLRVGEARSKANRFIFELKKMSSLLCLTRGTGKEVLGMEMQDFALD